MATDVEGTYGQGDILLVPKPEPFIPPPAPEPTPDQWSPYTDDELPTYPSPSQPTVPDYFPYEPQLEPVKPTPEPPSDLWSNAAEESGYVANPVAPPDFGSREEGPYYGAGSIAGLYQPKIAPTQELISPQSTYSQVVKQPTLSDFMGQYAISKGLTRSDFFEGMFKGGAFWKDTSGKYKISDIQLQTEAREAYQKKYGMLPYLKTTGIGMPRQLGMPAITTGIEKGWKSVPGSEWALTGVSAGMWASPFLAKPVAGLASNVAGWIPQYEFGPKLTEGVGPTLIRQVGPSRIGFEKTALQASKDWAMIQMKQPLASAAKYGEPFPTAPTLTASYKGVPFVYQSTRIPETPIFRGIETYKPVPMRAWGSTGTRLMEVERVWTPVQAEKIAFESGRGELPYFRGAPMTAGSTGAVPFFVPFTKPFTTPVTFPAPSPIAPSPSVVTTPFVSPVVSPFVTPFTIPDTVTLPSEQVKTGTGVDTLFPPKQSVPDETPTPVPPTPVPPSPPYVPPPGVTPPKTMPPKIALPPIWPKISGDMGGGTPTKPKSGLGNVGVWQTLGFPVYGPHPLKKKIAGGIVGRRSFKYGNVVSSRMATASASANLGKQFKQTYSQEE